MTTYEVYIQSPSKVEELGKYRSDIVGDVALNSPPFPESRDAFFAIRDGVLGGRMRGAQVDWGSWAAVMSGDAITVLLDELFGPPGAFEARHRGSMGHMAEQMFELRAFVGGLSPGRQYAVVVEEF